MSNDNAATKSQSPALSDIAIPSELQILSNREPYEHSYDDGTISLSKPTGGLTTALDGALQEIGGTWIAWGSGNADFDPAVVTDDEFRPDDTDSEYILRRLDLSDDEIHEYYYGYSNQVLWPLCHLETEHIVYDESFWETYEAVNTRFGHAVDISSGGVVWIQDYHLALVPRVIREDGGTDCTLLHFWHIPWPPLEMFETCPQRQQLLDGLLGNDAIGFHITRYRDQFLDCVQALLPTATVDEDDGSVQYKDHVTETYVSPVGVNTDATPAPQSASGAWPSKRRAYDIDTSKTLAVGVDRLDYTKGLVEKIAALDRLFTSNPALRGELTLIQKVSKSRERIPSYRRYDQRVLEKIETVNDRFRTADWQPVVYINESFDRATLRGLLSSADIGIVSSRRDGLNLVAEELVHETRADPAVLLLSEFTGAATLFDDGPITINPFDIQQFASALLQAVEMDTDERKRRHAQMCETVEQYSLRSWLATHADLITTLTE